jgi:predicted ATPase/transcriptional regulator with XRE-family HTH domain
MGEVSGDQPASFASLLRAHRRTARMTQAELADRAALGVRTVRDLEHGRSTRPQRSTVELLASSLGLVDDELAEFLTAARGQAGSPKAPSQPPAQTLGLPAAGVLFGRAQDVDALVAHLQQRPGLTLLVGLAGVGKSSLALTVAHRLGEEFAGGVAAISVAAEDTAADVWEVVSAVFGVARPSQLTTRLTEPALLMIDAIDRAPEPIRVVLAELLATAPQLRVLASARAPLGLAWPGQRGPQSHPAAPAEHVWPIGPLALPPGNVATLQEARDYPASALFLARWTEVRGHPPTEREVPALVTLVRRLGGLPLAIELAAARGRVLDAPEMLARYGDRLLELGGPDNHSASPMDRVAPGTVTLRDVVTASYRLLPPGPRSALRWLSGFGYRWSIELAEDLLGPQVDVVRVLDSLVELGLVQVRGTGALRFVLLDVVKAFALEQAEAANELAEIRRQHARVFARFAGRLAPMLAGPTMTEAVASLDEVASDLWSALTHSADHDPETALSLAAQLPRWWRFRGRDQQGQDWLVRLLDDPRTADADPTIRAWAQLGVVQLAAEHGAGLAELDRAEAALAHFARISDVTGELATRAVLLQVQQAVGSYDEARRHGEASLALATRAGRVRDVAIAQHNLIWHDLRVADLAAAQRRLAAVDRLCARAGEPQLRALARANLAEVLRLDGRYDEAVRVGQQAATMLAEVGRPGERRRLLGVIGLSHALAGQLDEAEKTLVELRSQLPDLKPGADPVAPTGPGRSTEHSSNLGLPDGEPPDDWDCAMIEATLARQRGQLTLAAAWYEAATRASDGNDLRDIAEALVGVVATGEDPAAARTTLRELCDAMDFTLTERERAELGW